MSWPKSLAVCSLSTSAWSSACCLAIASFVFELAATEEVSWDIVHLACQWVGRPARDPLEGRQERSPEVCVGYRDRAEKATAIHDRSALSMGSRGEGPDDAS